MPVEKDISPLEKAMMTAQVQNIFGDKQSYEYEGAAAESTYQPYGTMYDYTEPMQGGDEMGIVESMLSPGPGYDVLGRMKGKWESGKPMQAAGELPLLLLALGGLVGGRLSKKLIQKMVKGKLTKAEAAKVERALEHVRTTGEGVLASDNPVIQKMYTSFMKSSADEKRIMANAIEKALYESRNITGKRIPRYVAPPPSDFPIQLPERMGDAPLLDAGGFIKGRR